MGPIDTSPIPIDQIKNPKRFWDKAEEMLDGCWLWQSTRGINSTLRRSDKGYGEFHIAGRDYPAHRVAYELMYGQGTADGWYVLHHCDTPACVNPKHLYTGTQADNTRDRVDRGRSRGGRPKGSTGKHRAAGRVTPEEASEIRRKRRELGSTFRQLSEEHKLSYGYIGKIVRGEVHPPASTD